jgi:putative transposase
MIAKSVSDKRHRFPPEIIARTVWLYFRFPLSLRLVEEMRLERGIVVSCETIRRWARTFGPDYAKRFRRKPARSDDIWLRIPTIPADYSDLKPAIIPR